MTWGELTLGEVVEIKHGWAFKGEYFSDAGELVLLTPGNVFETGGLKLKGDKEKYYTGEFPEEFLLESGDMIVVMTDLIQNAPILGASLIIPEDNRYLHNQRLGLVNITDPSRIDYKFLYYVFNSPIYRGQIRGSATGATVRHTAPKRIYACKVPYPIQISEQKKIAGILSAYDDLIDNNNRRIALLEEAIHWLYREWFVHLRFPGHEHTPVVAGVPEGWEKRPLGDVVKVNPTTRYEKGKPSPYVPMAAVSESSMVISGIEERPITGGPKFVNGDTLLARITPCLENGKTGFVQFLETDEIVASGSTEFIVLREDMLSRYWIYCLARTHEFRQHAINSMVGSDGRQRVQPVSVMGYQVPAPPKPIVSDFDDYAQKIFKQINTLNRQNGKLREARDALLPRLMNGSLPV